MSGNGSDIETRRRRAHFRAWHRGMREADLLVGGFADSALASMNDAEIGEFERLLDIPDADIVRWVTGEQAVPLEKDNAILRKLIAFGATSGNRS